MLPTLYSALLAKDSSKKSGAAALSGAKEAARRCFKARKVLPASEAKCEAEVAAMRKANRRHAKLDAKGSARVRLQFHATAAAEDMCRLLSVAVTCYLNTHRPPIADVTVLATKGLVELGRLGAALAAATASPTIDELTERLFIASCAVVHSLTRCPEDDMWQLAVQGLLLDVECALRYAYGSSDRSAAAAAAERWVEEVRQRVRASVPAVESIDAAACALIHASVGRRTPLTAAQFAKLRAEVIQHCEAFREAVDGGEDDETAALDPTSLEMQLLDGAVTRLVATLNRCRPALKRNDAPAEIMFIATSVAVLGEEWLSRASAAQLCTAAQLVKRGKQLDITVQVASDAAYAAFKVEEGHREARRSVERMHERDLLITLAAVECATSPVSLLLSTPCEARETFEAYAVEIARVFGYECSDAAAAVSLSLKAYVTDSFDRWRKEKKKWATEGWATAQVAARGAVFYEDVYQNIFSLIEPRVVTKSSDGERIVNFRREEAMEIMNQWVVLWDARKGRGGDGTVEAHPDETTGEVAKRLQRMCNVLLCHVTYFECLEKASEAAALHCLEQAGRMYEQTGHSYEALSCFRRGAMQASKLKRCEHAALFDALCYRHEVLRAEKKKPIEPLLKPAAKVSCQDEGEEEEEESGDEEAYESDACVVVRTLIARGQAALLNRPRADLIEATKYFEEAMEQIGDEPLPEDGALWCTAWKELRLGVIDVKLQQLAPSDLVQSDELIDELVLLGEAAHVGAWPSPHIACTAFMRAASTLVARGARRYPTVWVLGAATPADGGGAGDASASAAAAAHLKLPPPPVMDQKALKKLKVVDLKKMLKERGLSVKGRKQNLVERLLLAFEETEAEAAADDSSSSSSSSSVSREAIDEESWERVRDWLIRAEQIAREVGLDVLTSHVQRLCAFASNTSEEAARAFSASVRANTRRVNKSKSSSARSAEAAAAAATKSSNVQSIEDAMQQLSISSGVGFATPWPVVTLSLDAFPGELCVMRQPPACEQCVAMCCSCFHDAALVRIPLRCGGCEEPASRESVLAELASVVDRMHHLGHSNQKHTKKTFWTEYEAIDSIVKETLQLIEDEWIGKWRGMMLGEHEDAAVRATVAELQRNVRSIVVCEGGGGDAINVNVLDAWVHGEFVVPPRCDADQECGDVLTAVGCTCVTAQLGKKVVELVHAARASHSAEELTLAPLVLVLDGECMQVPWETLPFIGADRNAGGAKQPISRVASWQWVVERAQSQSQSNHDVLLRDSTVWMCPDDELVATRKNMTACFKKTHPTSTYIAPAQCGESVVEAVRRSQLYVYCGHGDGARYFCDTETKKRRKHLEAVRRVGAQPRDAGAVALIMGCSSAKLECHGDFGVHESMRGEGPGCPLAYLDGGFDSVVGMLWDVTDKQIDLITKKLLGDLQPAGQEEEEACVLQLLPNARRACKAKCHYAVGAALVCFGLPPIPCGEEEVESK